MKPWISIGQYEENMSSLNDVLRLMCKDIFFVEIAPPCHYLIDNLGSFSSDVKKYNDVLRRLNKEHFLTPFSDEKDYESSLLPDGHHLTRKGHLDVANSIINLMK